MPSSATAAAVTRPTFAVRHRVRNKYTTAPNKTSAPYNAPMAIPAMAPFDMCLNPASAVAVVVFCGLGGWDVPGEDVVSAEDIGLAKDVASALAEDMPGVLLLDLNDGVLYSTRLKSLSCRRSWIIGTYITAPLLAVVPVVVPFTMT